MNESIVGAVVAPQRQGMTAVHGRVLWLFLFDAFVQHAGLSTYACGYGL